jgi:TonB family protein
VRVAKTRRWVVNLALGLGLALAVGLGAAQSPAPGRAQEAEKAEAANAKDLTRKARTRVEPVYPDMARRMNITGTVRLAIVVAPNGTVKSSKAVGGHPLLVNAAMDAMTRWKFEPAPAESSGIVEFNFQPQN